MKTLLFNGCSFMAGDSFAYDQFNTSFGRPLKSWHSAATDDFKFRKLYLEYRKNINLPACVSKRLKLRKIDISLDGSSNEHIALETIAYIQTIPVEERKKYHVVVGWTAISRVMKYSTVYNAFIDLTIGHYQRVDPDPVKSKFDEYIKARIIDIDIHDHFMDYARSIMLLENFLKCNNITYTFFRSVDVPIDDDVTVGPFTFLQNYKINQQDVTDHSCWYKFNPPFPNNHLPFAGHSWATAHIDAEPGMKVSDTNPHPNAVAIDKFAAELANFIPSTF